MLASERFDPAWREGLRTGQAASRTRAGGDNWDASDVPLSEDIESYEIDIMSGASVKRTISSTIASAVYTAAQQLVDFGAAQTSVEVRVYQMSTRFGRGTPGAAIV